MAPVATGAVCRNEVAVFDGKAMIALPIRRIPMRRNAETLRESRVLMAASAGLGQIADEDAGAWVGLREDCVSRMAVGAVGGLADPLGTSTPMNALLVLRGLAGVAARADLGGGPSGLLLMGNALDVAVTVGAREVFVYGALECRAIESIPVAIPAICGSLPRSESREQHQKRPTQRYHAHDFPQKF
jgi:hypothetical protein